MHMKTASKTLALFLTAICLLLMMSNPSSLRAQSSSGSDENFAMSISLTSDQFFGFAPMAAGTYKLGNTVDLSFTAFFGRAELVAVGVTGQNSSRCKLSRQRPYSHQSSNRHCKRLPAFKRCKKKRRFGRRACSEPHG